MLSPSFRRAGDETEELGAFFEREDAAGLQAAVSRVQDVEWLCGVWRRAKEMGGPVVIDDAELARVAERFRTYGQPR